MALELTQLEALIAMLKRHQVYVFKSEDIQIQFAPQAFAVPVEVNGEGQVQGVAEDDDERMLFLAAEG